MCTATISPGKVGTSSYWAREFLTSSSCASPDKDFVVYSIFFLETVQMALSGADLYYWFSAGFDNGDQLVTPFASFFDLQILGSVVSLCVQLFFVFRIRVLGRLSKKRSRWLCVTICLVIRPSKLRNDLFILPYSSPLLAR
jgi:hypothetical protein